MGPKYVLNKTVKVLRSSKIFIPGMIIESVDTINVNRVFFFKIGGVILKYQMRNDRLYIRIKIKVTGYS